MNRVVAFTLGLIVVAGLRAQDPDKARLELERTNRELQQVRSDADQLLDARIRHDLGLPQQDSVPVLRTESGPASTAPAIERAQLQLAQEEAVTGNLLSRYERLRVEVELLQRETAERAAKQSTAPEWMVVPVAGGDRPAPHGEPRSQPALHAPSSMQQPARPDGESIARVEPRVRVVSNLDPIRAQIDGSQDHGLVAQALLKASQALIDRCDVMRAQSQGEAADEALDEARQRLERALEELKHTEVGDKPSFSYLFHQGRCRELLFRISERRDGLTAKDQPKEFQRREQEVRDAYVAITARDVVRRGDADALGPWGRAAQAAMDHFRWINLHSGYAPKVDPRTITWPGYQQ